MQDQTLAVGEFSIVGPRGKSKDLFLSGRDSGRCNVVSSDRISARDGEKKDEIPGKGVMANITACNVFAVLAQNGISTAYLGKSGDNSFYAYYTDMVPLEVVVRRTVGEKSSFRQRHPDTTPNHRFEPPKVEFFLKTSGKKWGDTELPSDDPILVPCDKSGPNNPPVSFEIHDAHEVLKSSAVLGWVSAPQLKVHPVDLENMGHVALEVFLILEKAWAKLGARLEDIKLEFGWTQFGQLVLSDIIENDSWRLWYDGHYVCKQGYRDDAAIRAVVRDYALVAKLSKRLGG